MRLVRRWPVTCTLVALAVLACFVQAVIVALAVLVVGLTLPDRWLHR